LEGIDVAIKQWHLENLSKDLLQEFINEAKIMNKCRHPNIVQFFAICIKQGKDSLIMEYLPNGSLYQNLSDSR
jgi:serine/threonine protein kinase